jgi:hypothetical protein
LEDLDDVGKTTSETEQAIMTYLGADDDEFFSWGFPPPPHHSFEEAQIGHGVKIVAHPSYNVYDTQVTDWQTKFLLHGFVC